MTLQKIFSIQPSRSHECPAGLLTFITYLAAWGAKPPVRNDALRNTASALQEMELTLRVIPDGLLLLEKGISQHQHMGRGKADRLDEGRGIFGRKVLSASRIATDVWVKAAGLITMAPASSRAS